ncbi:hypothetical protein ACFCY8_30205 [Streptomyces noursei]|uniref:hypothetical protein n=1 Tax=Streptomyces noursei TaxID=1971 RepID=UPI0035DCEAE4
MERLGGLRQTPVSDRPRLNVECWSDTESGAHDLAALTRALVGALPGVRDGVTVYRVTEVGGPQWLPDSATSSPRYAFAVEVHMRGKETYARG